MKNQKIIYAVIFCITFFLAGCKDSKQQALGTLERDRVILTATANEIITKLPLKKGSTVKKGDLLVQLDTTKQNAIIASAQATEAQAKAKLIEAQATFKRTDALVKKNFSSDADIDQAQANLDQAKASLDLASSQLRLQQQILKELTVTATRDGILDSIPYNLGERVPLNAVVAAIQADNQPYARVYVPEPYRARLHVGDRLNVHIDGIDKTFQGVLRWVATESSFTPYYALNESDRSHLVYLAEVDMGSDASNIANGIPVQVEMPQ